MLPDRPAQAYINQVRRNDRNITPKKVGWVSTSLIACFTHPREKKGECHSSSSVPPSPRVLLWATKACTRFFFKTCHQLIVRTVPCVVVGRIGHLARAVSGRAVAMPVGIGAVVQAGQVLTVVPVVPRMAHASGNWELHGAPAVEGAVVRAVLHKVGGGRVLAERRNT